MKLRRRMCWCPGLCVALAMASSGAAEQQPATDVRILTKPVHGMVATGGSLEIRITAEKKGAPLAGETLSLRQEVEGQKSAEDAALKLDKDGCAVYGFATPADAAPGVRSLVVTHAGSGASHTMLVDVVDAATYQRFEQAARQVKLPLPAHLLFLGDSLTDNLRGRNYVDKIAFWLQSIHGQQVTVKNAGVGGDFTGRVWDRLNGNPKVHRLEMYDKLLEPVPNKIFLLLGANDCKVSSESGYTKPCVSFENVDTYYHKIIERLRRDTKADITLISAPSFVAEIQKAAAEKMTAQNKPHNLFGKPEAVERFNAVVRKVADDVKCDWIDLYEPTRGYPNKPSLFMPAPDGVHLNDNGNRLVALKILEHLAALSKPPEK